MPFFSLNTKILLVLELKYIFCHKQSIFNDFYQPVIVQVFQRLVLADFWTNYGIYVIVYTFIKCLQVSLQFIAVICAKKFFWRPSLNDNKMCKKEPMPKYLLLRHSTFSGDGI